MSGNTELVLSSYRISGWYRDEPDEIRHIDFEAADDDSAWHHELPPKFMSLELGKFDGKIYHKLHLSTDSLRQAIEGILLGIAHPTLSPTKQNERMNR